MRPIIKLTFKTFAVVFFLLVLMITCLTTYLLLFPQPKTFEREQLSNDYPQLKAASTKLIRRGEYIAKISNCISCHTSSESLGAFSGRRKIHTPFGIIYSTNITPDNETGLGKWTLANFTKAMRFGVGPKGKHYYPAFPYPAFAHMSNADLKALYAYFRVIPAIKQKNTAPNVPFSLPGARSVMAPMEIIFT